MSIIEQVSEVKEPKPVLQFERNEKVGALRVNITEERVKSMKAGIFRTLTTNPENQFKFVAHYMVKPSGDYMTYQESCVILDELSITEVGTILTDIMVKVQELAAPKT